MKTVGLRTSGSVAVVGAGPGGLMLARLLRTRGVEVAVYERDTTATSRRQGGSLDLRPDSGQRAIDAAGLGEVFKRVSRDDAKAFRLVSSEGVELAGAGGETHEDAGPEIDRGDLRQLLLDSLAPGVVRWDHTVDDVMQTDDGHWQLQFTDQDSVVADLVVGADGIGSRVRRRLTTVLPSYVGHTMLAAHIREDLWRGSKISDVLGEGSVMFAGGHKTIFVQRCADDLILLYFSLPVASDWPVTSGFNLDDTDAVLRAIGDIYHDWSPALLAMLTQVDATTFQRWPLSVMPPHHQWDTQVGLTMLGDASHVMPPFTGKGVNLALLDALDLADALTSGPDADVTEAVRGFETRMQARTRIETRACLDVGRNFYGIDALALELEAV